MNKRSCFLVCALFAWSFSSGNQAVAAESASLGPPAIGTHIDSIRLTDYQGKEWNLEDVGDQKAIVFAFIGTQCPLARLYTAKLVELETQFRERGVLFVAVDSNVQDSLAEMSAHARKFHLEFAFLKDPAQQLANLLGATRTPEVCVLDGKQQLRYRGRIDDQYGIGYTRATVTESELVAALEAILNDQEVSITSAPACGCLIGRGSRDLDKPDTESMVTYANQVSRILQARCVSCHRPGEIGPMDLSNFEDASAWSDMLAEVIDEQRMPPWHANPQHGSFKNDRRMPQEEIDTIKKWVRNGAPRGNPSNEPAQIQYVNGWQMPSEPDLVIPMAEQAYEIPARGEVKYQHLVVDPKLTKDIWVGGMEIVPGNRSVVHHILVFVRPKGTKGRGVDAERGFLAGFVPGARVEMMPPGMAKRIPVNSELVFQIHYTTNGTAQKDLSKIGFWFADPATITHEVETTSTLQTVFRIPPHDGNYKTSAMQPEELPECELLSMSPHMHVRGKSFRYTAVYPDQSREILLDVPNYDFNWQTDYRLTERKKLPNGTRIFCEAVFDNSSSNLNNPDPDSWVSWGDQTHEEMMIGYFHVAIPLDPTSGRAPAVKKAPTPRPTPSQIFRVLDSDGDGKLLKSEVPKQVIPFFERLDLNKDGILELSELPK